MVVTQHATPVLQEHAVLHLPALRPQYPYAITDQGFNLRGRQFNVTVAWNAMPKVGALSKQVRTFAGAFLLVTSKLALLICLAIRFV